MKIVKGHFFFVYKLLVLFSDNGIFIAKPEKGAFLALMQKKARHFVLIKVDGTGIGVCVVIVIII